MMELVLLTMTMKAADGGEAERLCASGPWCDARRCKDTSKRERRPRDVTKTQRSSTSFERRNTPLSTVPQPRVLRRHSSERPVVVVVVTRIASFGSAEYCCRMWWSFFVSGPSRHHPSHHHPHHPSHPPTLVGCQHHNHSHCCCGDGTAVVAVAAVDVPLSSS